MRIFISGKSEVVLGWDGGAGEDERADMRVAVNGAAVIRCGRGYRLRIECEPDTAARIVRKLRDIADGLEAGCSDEDAAADVRACRRDANRIEVALKAGR